MFQCYFKERKKNPKFKIPGNILNCGIYYFLMHCNRGSVCNCKKALCFGQKDWAHTAALSIHTSVETQLHNAQWFKKTSNSDIYNITIFFLLIFILFL